MADEKPSRDVTINYLPLSIIYVLSSEGVRGGPGGPWPPQYLALPRLESSEKAANLANTLPRFQNETCRQEFKTRFEGKILRRGKAKQILVARK